MGSLLKLHFVGNRCNRNTPKRIAMPHFRDANSELQVEVSVLTGVSEHTNRRTLTGECEDWV
ncbi:protein of unknown function [Nitrospira japonica]|uniref:Uncharacterized protein n=1 Tax=Nitrospira japonica TaxID=1325564 RepID=A0A1W1I353_9BACT|nr:protein of unknown function [Nitrospira japonica]